MNEKKFPYEEQALVLAHGYQDPDVGAFGYDNVVCLEGAVLVSLDSCSTDSILYDWEDADGRYPISVRIGGTFSNNDEFEIIKAPDSGTEAATLTLRFPETAGIRSAQASFYGQPFEDLDYTPDMPAGFGVCMDVEARLTNTCAVEVLSIDGKVVWTGSAAPPPEGSWAIRMSWCVGCTGAASVPRPGTVIQDVRLGAFAHAPLSDAKLVGALSDNTSLASTGSRATVSAWGDNTALLRASNIRGLVPHAIKYGRVGEQTCCPFKATTAINATMSGPYCMFTGLGDVFAKTGGRIVIDFDAFTPTPHQPLSLFQGGTTAQPCLALMTDTEGYIRFYPTIAEVGALAGMPAATNLNLVSAKPVTSTEPQRVEVLWSYKTNKITMSFRGVQTSITVANLRQVLAPADELTGRPIPKHGGAACLAVGDTMGFVKDVQRVLLEEPELGLVTLDTRFATWGDGYYRNEGSGAVVINATYSTLLHVPAFSSGKYLPYGDPEHTAEEVHPPGALLNGGPETLRPALRTTNYPGERASGVSLLDTLFLSGAQGSSMLNFSDHNSSNLQAWRADGGAFPDLHVSALAVGGWLVGGLGGAFATNSSTAIAPPKDGWSGAALTLTYDLPAFINNRDIGDTAADDYNALSMDDFATLDPRNQAAAGIFNAAGDLASAVVYKQQAVRELRAGLTRGNALRSGEGRRFGASLPLNKSELAVADEAVVAPSVVVTHPHTHARTLLPHTAAQIYTNGTITASITAFMQFRYARVVFETTTASIDAGTSELFPRTNHILVNSPLIAADGNRAGPHDYEPLSKFYNPGFVAIRIGSGGVPERLVQYDEAVALSPEDADTLLAWTRAVAEGTPAYAFAGAELDNADEPPRADAMVKDWRYVKSGAEGFIHDAVTDAPVGASAAYRQSYTQFGGDASENYITLAEPVNARSSTIAIAYKADAGKQHYFLGGGFSVFIEADNKISIRREYSPQYVGDWAAELGDWTAELDATWSWLVIRTTTVGAVLEVVVTGKALSYTTTLGGEGGSSTPSASFDAIGRKGDEGFDISNAAMAAVIVWDQHLPAGDVETLINGSELPTGAAFALLMEEDASGSVYYDSVALRPVGITVTGASLRAVPDVEAVQPLAFNHFCGVREFGSLRVAEYPVNIETE